MECRSFYSASDPLCVSRGIYEQYLPFDVLNRYVSPCPTVHAPISVISHYKDVPRWNPHLGKNPPLKYHGNAAKIRNGEKVWTRHAVSLQRFTQVLVKRHGMPCPTAFHPGISEYNFKLKKAKLLSGRKSDDVGESI